MRTASATKKWPASWMRMRNARPTMETAIFIEPASKDSCPGEIRGYAAWIGVHLQGLVETRGGWAVDLCQRPLDHVRDAQERQPVVEESCHGDLIGGIEHARRRPSCLPGGPAERQARKGVLIR